MREKGQINSGVNIQGNIVSQKRDPEEDNVRIVHWFREAASESGSLHLLSEGKSARHFFCFVSDFFSLKLCF